MLYPVLAVLLFVAVSARQFPHGRFLIDLVNETHVVVNSVSGEQLVRANLVEQTEHTGGWHLLSVEARHKYGDPMETADKFLVDYHRAAGIAEALITCEITHQYYLNSFYASFGLNGKPSPELKKFMLDNFAWMKKQAWENEDEYWIATRQTIAQFEGFIEGYSRSKCAFANPLGLFEFLVMNSYGDLMDLTVKFNLTQSTPDPDPHPLLRSRCSTLINPVDNCKDVIFGHTTWGDYSIAFPRIHKTMRLPVLQNGKWVMHQTAFSSSPGLIASLDDWYVLDKTSNLVVIETTINTYDHSLYERVVPESVPCWVRVTVANKLAVGGESWVNLFTLYHSGTYNNQWMAIDRSRARSGKIKSGFFYVLEELPGLVVKQDMTDFFLKQGYWPSYNIPFFTEIFEVSGYAEKAKHSDLYSYTKAPRPNIMRARHHLVEDVKSYEDFLLYNDWQHDPMSLGSASLSIAARGDLDQTAQDFAGAFDVKYSSLKHLDTANPVVFAKVGHTHKEQPVFCWSSYPNATTSRAGHPDCFPLNTVPIKIF
jgi:hypothetical protein